MLRYNFSGDLRLDMLKTFYRNDKSFPVRSSWLASRSSGIQMKDHYMNT